MTIKYFKGITNQKDLRKALAKLLKVHHPDNGGDADTCKAINVEYDYLFAKLPKDSKGTTAESSAEARKDFRLDKAIREMLNNIVHMDGINIEIVGSWIWVDGNSYPHKEELKSHGFQWSRKRKKWHWTADTSTGYHKGKGKDFEELRAKYGSSTVETEGRARIA